MADPADLIEIDKRIAVIRHNIRELVEQAAAFSGAALCASAAPALALPATTFLDDLALTGEFIASTARPLHYTLVIYTQNGTCSAAGTLDVETSTPSGPASIAAL